MRKLSSGLRIVLAFLIIALIFGIMGVIGIVNIKSINENDNLLYNNNTMGIVYSGDAATAYEQVRFNILSLSATKDADLKQNSIADIEKSIETVDLWLSQYELTILPNDKNNLTLYESLTKNWNQYKGFVETSIGYAKSNINMDLSKYTSELILVQKKDLSDTINAQFASLYTLNKNMALKVNKQNNDYGESATMTMTIMVIVGVVLAVALGILIGSSIGRMVKRASKQLALMADGEHIEELDVNKFSGEFISIANNLNDVRTSLQRMLKDASLLVQAGIVGRLSTRADVTQHSGNFRAIIEGFNKTLDAFIAPIDATVSVLIKEMQKGNLSATITGDYPGDHAIIKDALNDTITEINSYVSEVSGILSRVAQGDLTVQITSEYRGDFVKLKDSINSIIASFNMLLSDIQMAADQVAAGAQQVSGSSQTISQGAAEQASSIEQLTASTTQMASQTRQNAEDAMKTSDLSADVKNSAQDGDSKMAMMQESMNDIRSSSENISKIIRVIDDIAFQTNILALNAAVEAARAGSHGKGFAVVAEEVRNLAARSAKAADETTSLIENSVNKVKAGNVIANDTAEALRKMVEGSDNAAQLVGGIAEASNQQATAIMQINRGIDHLSEIVQSNSASAEETAAAAEELSSQAQMLQQMVARFNLMSGENRMSESGSTSVCDYASAAPKGNGTCFDETQSTGKSMPAAAEPAQSTSLFYSDEDEPSDKPPVYTEPAPSDEPLVYTEDDQSSVDLESQNCPADSETADEPLFYVDDDDFGKY